MFEFLKILIRIGNFFSLALNTVAGHVFVVAKEVFIMETVVFWHCDNG